MRLLVTPSAKYLVQGIGTEFFHCNAGAKIGGVLQIVATCYDRLAANYLAFIKVASMRIWLRAYESAP